MKSYILLLLGLVLSFSLQAQTMDTIPEIELSEVSVIANNTIHKKNSDVFLITQDMRERYKSVNDILKILPNISFNDVSNTVKVFNNENVLFTVNNKPESRDIISGISPERIRKIEVFTNPARRFRLMGYDYVINVSLINDYVGNDVYISNFMMITPNYNKKNYIANEQPGIMYSYSSKKFSISGMYGFANINWNFPTDFSKKIGGDIDYSSSPASKHNPNNDFNNISHSVNISSDYRFNDNTQMSVVLSYLNEDINESTDYNINHLTDNSTRNFKEIYNQGNLSRDAKVSAILESKLNDKIDMHVDLNYNYQTNKIDNGYIIPDVINNQARFRGIKNYLSGNIDFTFSSDKLNLNWGALATYNRYKMNYLSGNPLSKDTDIRSNIYVSAEYMFSEALMGSIGATFVDSSKSNNVVSKNKFNILPNASLSFNPNSDLSLLLNYESKIEYPILTQISQYGYMIDDYLKYVGNPNLNPAIIHELNFIGQYKSLSLNSGYTVSRSFITEVYNNSYQNEILLSNINAKYQKWWVGLAYDYHISRNLIWKNSVEVSKNYMSNHDYSSAQFNWTLDSHLDWWIPRPRILFSADYSRSMYNSAMLQGKRMTGFDIYQLSLQRAFFKNSLSVSLSYIPPINLGRKMTQTFEIKSNFYHEINRMNLSVYNNLIMFRVAWRFNRGKVSYPKSYDLKFDEEKVDRKGLL
ncbi:MAG: outer membrane beta-barrel family protein [Muribaculaceae bacterium]|nr:outer membrane beta-barrel family protein [Muribaculaceae bacterium]MDE6351550.1 outer membrane beta-barrel family protein [Muribaculaceae bacterium]